MAMKRVRTLQITIILLVTIIALSIAIYSVYNSETVSVENQELNTSQMELLFWDLKSGEFVSGSFNYHGGYNSTSFTIYNPQMVEIQTSEGVGTHYFSFIAQDNGYYRLYTTNDQMWNNFIDYQYNITPTILGFSPMALIITVIVVGIVIEGTILLINRKCRLK
jgi:hypothetical protein